MRSNYNAANKETGNRLHRHDGLRHGLRNGLLPVSYTHLDVYKRQDLLNAVADGLLEGILDVVADDKDDLVKAGLEDVYKRQGMLPSGCGRRSSVWYAWVRT